MTASRNKASRAVTAALVGVLSVGAVPMVAVAAESGAVTLATDDAVVNRATVTYWGGLEDEYAYTGRGTGPVPKTVELVNEDAEDVVSILPTNRGDRADGAFYYYYVALDEDTVVTSASYKVTEEDSLYYVNSNGSTVSLSGCWQVRDENGDATRPVRVGTYAVVVGEWDESEESFTYVSVCDTFSIVGQTLDDAYLCDYLDATDTTFNYTGEKGGSEVEKIKRRVNVAIDGYVLEKNEDYTLEVWETGSTKPLNDDEQLAIGTTYVVKVIGQGRFKGQEVEREFTLGKLDLSEADVTGKVFLETDDAPDQSLGYEDAVVSINGISSENINWAGLNPSAVNREGLKLVFVSAPDGSKTCTGEKGAYTYELVASDDNPNVEGSATVTVYYADYSATINYTGGLDIQNDCYFVDLAQTDVEYFDVDDIDVIYNGDIEINPRFYDVTITDASGAVVTDMTQPGTYTVSVSVGWTDDNGKYVAGSETFTVVVGYIAIQDTDVFLSYRDDNVSDFVDDTYDGTDLSQYLSAKVMVNNDVVLTEGTDYTVSYQRVDDDGRVSSVDEIVDAGCYKVIITGVTYSGTAEFLFIVRPAVVSSSSVAVDTPYVQTETDEDGNVTFVTYLLPYTGDVIEPTFTYNGVALDPSLYQVEYVRDPDADGKGERVDLQELGSYVAHLTTADGVTNYDIDATVRVVVTDQKIFADVTNDQWYSEYVYAANSLGYMSGYADGTFFGPMDSLSRADAVVVLWNMAGKPDGTPSEGSTSDLVTYDLPYTDVDEGAYYAQALQWATKLGIVAGDGDAQETFRPSASVTREELAKMLYVYEDLQGNVGDVDVDATLAAYEDEGTVSAWARTYVAYLVDEGVMGVNSGLKGGDDITRAEVAAMVVRVQPDGPLDGFMTSK